MLLQPLSADVRDPFLGLRFGCGSRLCRKLEHCCFLSFGHVSQAHDLAVWKFLRISPFQPHQSSR
jgi:hypothetical protein